MDVEWWNVYAARARKEFKGMLVSTHSEACALHGIIRAMSGNVRMETFHNSGAAAIMYAVTFLKASEVLLLGYDCSFHGGKRHWHADHPKGMGNAGTLDDWQGRFKKLADKVSPLPVVNCSRRTALRMFPRGKLEEWL